MFSNKGTAWVVACSPLVRENVGSIFATDRVASNLLFKILAASQCLPYKGHIDDKVTIGWIGVNIYMLLGGGHMPTCGLLLPQ